MAHPKIELAEALRETAHRLRKEMAYARGSHGT
jgi:hypothetical protein